MLIRATLRGGFFVKGTTMDFFDWTRYSLTLSTVIALLAARADAVAALKDAAPERQDHSAEAGWFFFKLSFFMCMIGYAFGQLNIFLGYPFT